MVLCMYDEFAAFKNKNVFVKRCNYLHSRFLQLFVVLFSISDFNTEIIVFTNVFWLMVSVLVSLKGDLEAPSM